jgi:polyisoprenoid-binding protein YceI
MTEEPPTSSTTGVLVPPANGLPRAGTYEAAERSILEISTVLGPLTTLRGRLAVLENSLTVADTGDRAALHLEADVPSLRTTRPLAGRRLLGRRGLDARRNGLLRLEAARISTVDETYWRIRARLHIRATPVDITMKARIAACTEERIALIAIGAISSRTLRETCSVHLPHSVPANRVRLFLAADYR